MRDGIEDGRSHLYNILWHFIWNRVIHDWLYCSDIQHLIFLYYVISSATTFSAEDRRLPKCAVLSTRAFIVRENFKTTNTYCFINPTSYRSQARSLSLEKQWAISISESLRPGRTNLARLIPTTLMTL